MWLPKLCKITFNFARVQVPDLFAFILVHLYVERLNLDLSTCSGSSYCQTQLEARLV
jgi:hypothetical protein